MPVTLWPDERADSPEFAGAIAFRVDRAAGISEAGRITHPLASEESFPDGVHRSVVVGDRLFTVSQNGVLASSLATLAAETWVPFRAPAP
jgi:hypothetical protein